MKTVVDTMQWLKEQLGHIYSHDELMSVLSLILERYCGLSKVDIVTKKDATISDSSMQLINLALNRLLNHEPIQYVLEEAWFMGMRFKVNRNVLIPRPETEELVEWVLKDLKDKQNSSLHILDACTGSGCIALSLKKNIPSATVSAYDIKQEALNVAKANADVLKLNILFKQDDALNPASFNQNDSFDIIVSNPPYIGIDERVNMGKSVKDYEPQEALFIEGDVLQFYNAICKFAKKHLSKSGYLYFEINQKYSVEIESMLQENGYQVVIKKDLSGNYRMVRANF